MVTTIFSAPLSMEISLPPKDTSGEQQVITKIAESKLLLMYVDKADNIYYQIGADMKQPSIVTMDQLQRIIDDKNRNVQGLVMVLKLDQKASYRMMVDIIDAIQGVERSINSAVEQANAAGGKMDRYSVKFSLQDMNAWDEHVLEVVKAGGTVEE
jgi:biopolymer transport protein ExbD